MPGSLTCGGKGQRQGGASNRRGDTWRYVGKGRGGGGEGARTPQRSLQKSDALLDVTRRHEATAHRCTLQSLILVALHSAAGGQAGDARGGGEGGGDRVRVPQHTNGSWGLGTPSRSRADAAQGRPHPSPCSTAHHTATMSAQHGGWQGNGSAAALHAAAGNRTGKSNCQAPPTAGRMGVRASSCTTGARCGTPRPRHSCGGTVCAEQSGLRELAPFPSLWAGVPSM